MWELNIIKEDQYQEAINVELPAQPYNVAHQKETFGNYFFEEIRRKVKRTYGDERLYGGGLKIYSTINLEMQKWAQTALQNGYST